MTTSVYKQLVKAQSEFETVVFDKINPHFKSKYASLASIKAAIEPSLNANGFVITQPWESMDNGDMKLSTVLIHESGEKIQLASSIIKAGKTDQQLGCAVTYQRRYQISSALFLFAEEDDDGELNEGRVSPPQPIKKPELKNVSHATLSTEQVEEVKKLIGGNKEIQEEIKRVFGKKLISEIEAANYVNLMKIINGRLAA